MRQDNRTSGRLQQGLFVRSQFANRASCIKIANHDGERLAIAMFAIAESFDCGLVGCVDGKMKTADSFDGQNFAAEKPLDGIGYGIGALNSAAVYRFEPGPGTTLPACIWLGVEAAIQRIVVLRLALAAHWKDSHRGLRPIVGDATGNGETRTAVGAIEKGVAVAAVGWVEKFAKAIGAGSGISGNAGAYTSMHLAGDDAEGCFCCERQILSADRIDSGKWRRFGGEAVQECFNAGLRPLKLDDHPIRVVANEAGEVLLSCKTINEGPKSNPLNDTADPDTFANDWRTGVGQG